MVTAEASLEAAESEHESRKSRAINWAERKAHKDLDGDGNLEYEELARALRSEPSELVRGAREAYVHAVRDGPERRPSKLKRAQTTV